MKIIIISEPDTASCNIFEHLIGLREWQEKGEFQGNPLYFYEDFCLASIKDEHIFHDNVDEELSLVLNQQLDCIIYASRHRSESGKQSLTVHPIGNYGDAEFGGKPRILVPSAPHLMTEALRVLKKKAKAMEYAVSFEATHHGPYLQTPTFFIEIGSNEMAWQDKEAGRIIAETILEAKAQQYPVGIGVGGGHYAPRITDVALERKMDFGHIVPSYAIEHLTQAMAEKTVTGTEGAGHVYLHKKRLKSRQYSRCKELYQSLDVRQVRSSELEPLEG